MQWLGRVSFVFAILGLVFIYVFSPDNIYVYRTVPELSEACEGSVKVTSTLIRTFYSSKGSLLGMFKENDEVIFLHLKNHSVIKGETVLVRGKAELYRQQCWLFTDKLEVVR